MIVAAMFQNILSSPFLLDNDQEFCRSVLLQTARWFVCICLEQYCWLKKEEMH